MSQVYRCLYAVPLGLLLLAGLVILVRDLIIDSEDEWPINPSYFDYDDMRADDE
jgi:hypothetical protein